MRRSTAILPTDGALGVAVVRVEPAGIDIPLGPGEPLMAAARRIGIRWPSVCGGVAQCGVCAVEVTAGEPAAPALREQQMLARLPVKPRHGGTMRLACQMTANGGIEVTKLGVRKPAHA